MKVKVTNISNLNIERLGHVFAPGVSQEVELNNQNEFIAISAAKALQVEEIKAVKKVEKTEEVKSAKKVKSEDKGAE